MAQNESFFSPVIQALAEREQILARKQQAEIQQKRLEQEQQRIDLSEKTYERLLKQQEANQKAENLKLGVAVKKLADLKRAQLTGTPTAPASQSIPGAGQIQQQPLLENILQQRGSDVIVRGQENVPVNLDIPDPFTGQSQLKVPIGTTSELTRERGINEATRRAEEQRKLQLTGQQALLQAIARAHGQFPFQQALEETKAGNRATAEENKQKFQAEENKKNRDAAYARALLIAKSRGSEDPADLANTADLVELGVRDLNDFPSKERNTINTILSDRGSNTPSKSAIGIIEKMGQFPVMMNQFDDILKDLSGNKTEIGSALSGGYRKFKNIAVPDEVINKIEEMATGLAAVTKAVKGESGNPSNADIERARNLIPNPSLTAEANARRRKLFLDSFSSAANIGLSSVPVKQRQKIFEHYGVPFKAEAINKRDNTKAAPSGKPVVSGNGKIVEFDGRKYPAGQTFPIGNKTYRWKIKGDTAIPVEVQ